MVSEAERRRVGALIRKRRHELGMLQEDLAERVGVSRNAVSKWENGRSYPLRQEGKIEKVLRLSLSEPEGQLDFDPDDRDEVMIASWAVYSVDERQQKINDLRARKRTARKTA